MNKSEFIEYIVDKSVPKNEKERKEALRFATKCVNLFFDSVSEALKQKDKVEIRGLGTFTMRHHKGYTGRNPRTAEQVKIPPKYLPVFKPGKNLREQLNQKKEPTLKD